MDVFMEISDVFADLTKRENVVLAELSKGRADKEIANNLVMSVPTVRTHLRSIYFKLKVRSRTEAVIKYLQLN
ncbi:MAG: LuxR C-terminal-related transcriptional regulator [Verrucomicrobiota bacterium]